MSDLRPCWDIGERWCASRANGHPRCAPTVCLLGFERLRCGCVVQAVDVPDDVATGQAHTVWARCREHTPPE